MTAASQAAPPRAAAEAEARTRDFFGREIPEPYTILGLRLRPLSLGRYRLLQRFNVAFVADGPAQAEVVDLLLGVLICSMRCEEFLEFIGSPNAKKEIARWSKSLSPLPWFTRSRLLYVVWDKTRWAKRWREKHSFNIVEKIKLFNAYITEAQQMPHYSRKQENPALTAFHWSKNVEVTLRSELGWSAEEINEAPLTKALVDYFKHAENQGLIVLFSDDELTIADRNWERISAALEEWKAKQGGCGGGDASSPVHPENN